jgi:hypothetical protein
MESKCRLRLAAGVLASRAGFSNINKSTGKYSRYTNGSDLKNMQLFELNPAVMAGLRMTSG